MFAVNDRITVRQMYFQIVLSMAGMFTIVLPGTHGLYGWLGAASCVCAFLIWIVYAFFLVRISAHYGHLEKLLGTPGMKAYGIWSMAFYILTGAYVTNVTTELVTTYLISGFYEPLIKGILLAGCSMSGVPGVQRRGRMAEAMFPVLGTAFVVFLFLSLGQQLFQMETFGKSLYPDRVSIDGRRLAECTVLLFAASFGICGLPFLLHRVKGRRYLGLLGAIGTVLAVLAFVLLILQGSYGSDQVLSRRWPMVSFMEGIRIPGGFVFRIDPIWIFVLLLLLLFSTGSTLFYGNAIAKSVGIHWNWWWMPIIVYGVSLISTKYYGEWLLYLFCPVTILIQTAVGLRSISIRKKYERE